MTISEIEFRSPFLELPNVLRYTLRQYLLVIASLRELHCHTVGIPFLRTNVHASCDPAAPKRRILDLRLQVVANPPQENR
jgi:hypothetical protein